MRGRIFLWGKIPLQGGEKGGTLVGQLSLGHLVQELVQSLSDLGTGQTGLQGVVAR